VDEHNSVFDDAKTYYTSDERHLNTRAGARTRTYSQVNADSLALTACLDKVADHLRPIEQSDEADGTTRPEGAISERKPWYEMHSSAFFAGYW
jgi:hypothetical protein